MSAVELRDLLLIGALGAVIAASGMLSDWLRAPGSAYDLPFWGFFARRGLRREAVVARLGEETVSLAEMRCALCGSKGECRRQLRSRAKSPPADCPNVRLFR
jgi:hypothetical protein